MCSPRRETKPAVTRARWRYCRCCAASRNNIQNCRCSQPEGSETEGRWPQRSWRGPMAHGWARPSSRRTRRWRSPTSTGAPSSRATVATRCSPRPMTSRWAHRGHPGPWFECSLTRAPTSGSNGRLNCALTRATSKLRPALASSASPLDSWKLSGPPPMSCGPSARAQSASSGNGRASWWNWSELGRDSLLSGGTRTAPDLRRSRVGWSAEAVMYELVEALGVESDAEVSIDSFDCKGWTKEVLAADEEVWRSDHAADAAFGIVGLYCGFAPTDVFHAGQVTDPQQFGGIGEVHT